MTSNLEGYLFHRLMPNSTETANMRQRYGISENIESLEKTCVEKHIELILNFLNEFSFLFTFVNTQNGDAHEKITNTKQEHLLYFLWKNYFSERLPNDWQSYLLSRSDQELIEMMKYTQSEEKSSSFVEGDIPNSLRVYVDGCKNLRFHKSVIDSPSQILEYLPKGVTDSPNQTGVINQNFTHERELIRQMSPKKIHEIERLSEFISLFSRAVCKDCNNEAHDSIPTILDIGSGKGYLSHVLYEKYGLNVVAVDHNEQLVKKIQDKVDHKKKDRNQKNKFKAITSHLECNREQLSKMVNQMLETSKSVSSCSGNCIVGLHTCGDLSPILMDMYINDVNYTKIEDTKPLTALVNVGCCYHKMSERYVSDITDTDSKVFTGFPLSNFVNTYVLKNMKEFQLTRSGLILGCTENNIWIENNSEEVDNYWKRNAFRCAMEFYLHEYVHRKDIICPTVVYSFGSISEKHLDSTGTNHEILTDFSKYALAVLDRLHQTKILTLSYHDSTVVSMAEQSSYSNDFIQHLNKFYYLECQGNEASSRIKSVDIFWTLRAMIGPVIETLIFLDRYLFLLNSGVRPDVVQLFSENISPRCLALFAFK